MSVLETGTNLLDSPDWAPRVYPDLIVDRAGESLILLHPEQARWAVTNEAGLRLAQALDGSRSAGALCEELASRYTGATAQQIHQDLKGFLRQLYAANLLENAPLPKDAAKSKPPKMPDFSIYVTDQCNLQCKHCYVVMGNMPKTKLSTTDVFRLLDEYMDLRGECVVNITGGEPFLRKDILDIIEKALQRTRFVTVTTNAMLIKDEQMERLAKLPVRIQVSLDGPSAEIHDFVRGQGSFAKTWAAIERLGALGAPDVIISTTLTRCLLDQVKAMIDRAEDAGVRLLRFVNLNKMKAAEANWEVIGPDPEELRSVIRWLLLEFPRQKRKLTVRAGFPGFVPDADPNGGHWCPLGETTLVDSQGQAWNCPVLRGPEFTTGNIFDNSLDEIHHGEKNRRLREQMLQRRYVVEECRSCAWRNFCQGGCQASMYLKTGSLTKNDGFCDFRRELYREHVMLKLNGKLG
ncbi:MAG: PqqD family peptide modification chaperone [Sumerlaeia bacterium]